MKNELFKGLEESRLQFNKYQGKARIYIDFEDMTAWCKVQELPSYHSDSIIRLVGKDDLHGRNDIYGTERLNELAEAKLDKHKKGWEKENLEDDYAFAEYF